MDDLSGARTHPPFIRSVGRLATLSGNLSTFATLMAADVYLRLAARSHETASSQGESMSSLRSREVGLRLRDRTRIKCRLSDLGALRSVYLDGDYDFAESQIRLANTVLDIGAHVGTFTLWASSRSPSSSRIVALEPNPESFNYLQQNVYANGLNGRVQLIPGAIGGREGQGEVLGLSTPLGTRVERTEAPTPSGTRIYSLQSILESARFEHCDVLKMDCEGAEYETILDAPDETLMAIDMIMCEYHPVQSHSVDELLDRLERCGFKTTTQETSSGMIWATRT
jgi:FkbM family methyltransferase